MLRESATIYKDGKKIFDIKLDEKYIFTHNSTIPYEDPELYNKHSGEAVIALSIDHVAKSVECGCDDGDVIWCLFEELSQIF